MCLNYYSNLLKQVCIYFAPFHENLIVFKASKNVKNQQKSFEHNNKKNKKIFN